MPLGGEVRMGRVHMIAQSRADSRGLPCFSSREGIPLSPPRRESAPHIPPSHPTGTLRGAAIVGTKSRCLAWPLFFGAGRRIRQDEVAGIHNTSREVNEQSGKAVGSNLGLATSTAVCVVSRGWLRRGKGETLLSGAQRSRRIPPSRSSKRRPWRDPLVGGRRGVLRP
jgi:hypothetical protein